MAATERPTWLTPTNLAPPRALATLVPRERLLAALDRGLERPLTLVVAPAGSGKTVLVGDWARERCPHPVAWLTVDRDEDAGARFWPALLAALAAAPGVPADSPLHELEASPIGVDTGFLRALAAALATLPQSLVVVVDDLHFVGDEAVVAQLATLLGLLPPQIHLVLCSRRDPLLPVGRLRLEDAVVEVGAADLAFEPGEARALLAEHGIDLDNGDLALLCERTESWAAGLRLAALSLEHAEDRHAFLEAFAGDDRAVADYLAEQVLALESPERREFLLRTSIADRITGELADVLTGGTDGRERLLELERENLLIIGLDQRRTWFRYHTLLGELLRSELEGRLPGESRELHRRAAGWFAGHGLVREALAHAGEAADWELTNELVADHWLALYIDGEGATIGKAVARVPQDVVESRPELAVAAAMGLLLDQGALDAADELLDRAGAQLDRVPPARRVHFERGLAVVRLYGARMRGHLADADAEALAKLSAPPGQGFEEDLGVTAVALVSVGLASLFGEDPDRARDVLEEALDLGRRAGRDFAVLNALGGLAILAASDGHLGRGQALASEAVAIAEQRGWSDLPRMVPVYASLASVAHFRDETEQAAEWMERCRAAGRLDRDPMNAAAVALAETRLAMGAGDHEAALRHLRRGTRELGRRAGPSWMGRIATGMLLGALVAAGREDEARDQIAELGPDGAERTEVACAVARLCLQDGDPQGALDALRDPTPPPRAGFLFALDAALLQAVAHERLGDMTAAAAAVDRALAVAEVERIVRPILEFPGARRLLERAVRHGTSHRALIDELFDRLDGAAPAAQASVGIEPLTDRELAVLRYLPTSLSAGDIASELYVSPNTVKTHVRHIYAKLGVGRRSEAVRRARELRLIGGSAMRVG